MSSTNQRPTATAREPALIERDADLGVLSAALAGAQGGDGGLVVIEGPPGIGKSALLHAARAEATTRGVRSLCARGGELERAFPYGVARQLLERPARAGGEQLLSGAAALARAPLGLDDGTQATDSELSGAHGLYWLVCNLADQAPVVVVVDDAHWADESSLQFLIYLVRRLEGLPVAVLLAVRSGHHGDLVAELTAGPDARLLAPRQLSLAASARLVAAAFEGRAAAARFISVCHQVSGGNPFLLKELLQALAQDGIDPDETGAERAAALSPDAVRRSVLLRMRRLPPQVSALARAVAILGEDVELRHAAQLAGSDPAAASGAADQLAALHVLAPGRPLNMMHPLIGQTIRSDLPAAERAALHRGAARVLIDDGASADRVAPHLLLSEPLGEAWVQRTLRQAAYLALRRGAMETAARWLRRALAEGVAAHRPALLRQLGEAEWVAARDPAAAIEHLREAFALAEGDERRGHVALSLGNALAMTGDAPGAVELLARARHQCAGADPDTLLALEAVEALWLLETPLGAGRSWKALERHTALRGDTVGERRMLSQLALLRWRSGTAAEAAEFARRALAGTWAPGSSVEDLTEYLQACWLLATADEPQAVAEALRSIERLAFASSPITAGALAVNWGARAGLTGDLGECESQFRAALDSGALPILLKPAAYSGLAATLAERGDVDGAERALLQSHVGEHLPVAIMLTPAFSSRALVRQAQGRLEEALADFFEHGRRDAACGCANPAYPWRLGAAQCLVALGDPDQARALSDEHMVHARRWGTHSALGIALRGQALLEQGPKRIELLQDAIAQLARSPARLDHAHALVDLGVALRVAGRRAAATETLRDGLDRARRCGAVMLVQHAHAELITVGARPRRLQFSGAESLTATERRTASLAAQGMGNTEIAQALFVTRSTVEKHLSRAFTKLGVHSREQLGAALSPAES
jgi:DNA-binding CsgD family transcriptional regulator